MESGYACFCGNNPDYWRYGEAASTECNSVCFGDHTQPCGGDGRVILFDSKYGNRLSFSQSRGPKVQQLREKCLNEN